MKTEVMIMLACERPDKNMLPNPVHLRTDGDLDFMKAQNIAKDQAKAYYSEPMLLSWFDKKNGRYSPHEAECCVEGKPSWVEYARSRGGNLTIDINDDDFVFVFMGKSGLS
jgi:hypothetical protein